MSADLEERASDPSAHGGPSAARTTDVPSNEARAGARSSARPARTGLPLAIGVLYLARLLVALLASYPVVASVSASGVLGFEAGVGKLFEPGGFQPAMRKLCLLGHNLGHGDPLAHLERLLDQQ